MKTVLEMAREVGAHKVCEADPLCSIGLMAFETHELERLVELARADERNSWPAEMEAMERQVNILTDALAKQPTPVQEPVAGLSKTQAKAILDLALDLEKTGRLVAITEGQERTDFVARNRNIQCALEDALRNATTSQAQPAPVQELEEYDAGLFSAAGGGDVEWWWDYIRAELGRAYEHYQSQMTPPQAQPAREWVGLTDAERNECVQTPFTADQHRAIEAKLMERNR